MAPAYRPPPGTNSPPPLRTSNLNVIRIVGISFLVYLHRWRPHLGASVIAQGPLFAATVIVVERVVDSTRIATTSPSAEAAGPAAALAFVLLFLAFAGAFLFVLMSGAACQLVDYWMRGAEVSLTAAYRVAARRFAHLAAAMLAVFGGICLGLLVLGGVLAGVYYGSAAALQVDPAEASTDPRLLWLLVALVGVAVLVACAFMLEAIVRWSVFVQAVMIEDAGPVEALARSAALVRGRWRATAGVMLLLMVVPLVLMVLAGSGLGLALAPFVASGLMSQDIANHVTLVAAQLVLSPVAPIGVTVLFYALRDGPGFWDHVRAALHEATPDELAAGVVPG